MLFRKRSLSEKKNLAQRVLAHVKRSQIHIMAIYVKRSQRVMVYVKQPQSEIFVPVLLIIDHNAY